MDALKQLAQRPLPQIPGYRACALLGRGGMGEVYAAVEESSRTLVAIKLLRSDAAGQNARSRFDRECRILARFNHPHIARLLGFGVTGAHTPFLVMEYVEGQPLVDYCEAQTLSLTARLNLFRQACLAVAVAHSQRIVHRDIKPANILVTPERQVKLLDFGIAKVIDTATRELTQTGHCLLTPGYASYEQIAGGPVTPASDVYSLGVILLELVAATPDPKLQTIIEKATTENPRARYSSAGELAADIGAYLQGEPLQAEARPHIRQWTVAAAALAAALLAFLAYRQGPAERPIPSSSERSSLVARHLFNRLSASQLAQAETWFRKAINEDPASAAAHAGLADVFYFQGELGDRTPAEAFAQARAIAEKAVALDTKLPLAHAVLASVLQASDPRSPDVEPEFKKALTLDPQSARTLQGYGCFLMRRGRLEEARRLIERGRLIDPASPILALHEARVSYYSRDYTRAAAQLRALLDREPGFALAHYFLGLSYAYLGQPAEAESNFASAKLSPAELSYAKAWAQARNGNREPAQRLLQQGPAFGGALFLAIELGDCVAAFAGLADALEHGHSVIQTLRADPRFDALRPDPRFTSLLQMTAPRPAPAHTVSALVHWPRL